MRVFITGGTGLVGSHVAEQLTARGDAVRALVRPGSDGTHLESLGCQVVRGDATAATAELAVAMQGCDAVVHAAALVGARATRERYVDMNVTGTRAVIGAAARAGIARAVHVSSVAVYGPLGGVVIEERWREEPIHERAFYAWSKRAAELEAWAFHGQAGLAVTTVRPSLIYGERDRHVAPRLDRLTRAPVLPLPDGGAHVLPLVYAGNVARGIIAAIDRPEAAGRAYNLTRDNDLALRELIRSWAQAGGRRAPRILPVPGALLEGGARVMDALSRRVPGLDLPGLTRPARLVRADNPYDSSRARAELGWTDLVAPHEAIRRTVRWLEEERAPKTA